MFARMLTCLVGCACVLAAEVDWKPVYQDKPVTAEESAGIDAALPDQPIVAVQAGRRILIVSSTAGYRHPSIPVGKEALTKLGVSSGAYEAVVSDDPANFEPEVLKSFDAVLLLSATQNFFMPHHKQRDQFSDEEWHALAVRHNRLVDNLIAYVEQGGGLVGIHAATDSCYGHKKYGEAMGGYFNGHPWNAHNRVVINLEDPEHEVIKPVFGDRKDFEIKEEIYQFRDEPYSRERLRILMGVDVERSDKVEGLKRADNDYAVAWVQSVGEGRVFYTSIGHNPHIYMDPLMLNHYLAGIQFACGDLEADTTPSAQIAVPHVSVTAEPDTLPALENGKVPATFEELWRGFDPRAEPLEIEVLNETEQDGIILRTVRFRVGVFNGKRAMLAGIYGFPKGAKDLPGLLHIHGGGQYADWRPVSEMAKRGYAVLSVAWAGRYMTPDVKVGPDEVKLFWEDKTEDPNYRLTTDWGGVDAYHAPCRYPTNNFVLNPPSDSTIDPVKSPRNSGWFCVAMGTRRALTFLENQPEVDGDRMGVFGHSMGGHLTVLTAGSDERVKAAVPSCGGITDRDKYEHGDEYVTTLGDDVYLKRITCPIVFQIPSNDFHSEIDDLQLAVDEIKSDDWRMTCSPHHNHTDTAEYYVFVPLWFDQHLKAGPTIAETPESQLLVEKGNKIPVFAVKPDRPDEVIELNVFYTEQGEMNNRHNIGHVVNRYWRYAKATRNGDVWYADIPTYDNDSPLWVYANASYALDEEISGVGYGYGLYTADRYTVTSRMAMLTPEQKQAQGVAATLTASHVIEDFQGDWQKEWYAFVDKPDQWELKTHKVYSPMYRAPLIAKLVFEVRSQEVNHLAINTGKTWKIERLKGGNEWQTISLLPTDFNAHSPQDAIIDWQGMSDFKLSGSNWKGPRPEFRNLHWVEISLAEMMANRENKLAGIERVDGKVYLDIKDANVATGTWKPQMNKWLGSNQPIVHAGKTYEQGISVLPPSELNFFLGGKFKRLHAEALSTHAATVEFKVYVDRELVYDSGRVDGVGSQQIDLPLNGATELQLIATDGGDGIHGDIVAWADLWVE